jgi:hypothetical protein
MITASIILSSISAIALIWAILFEGELKKENRKGKLILAFKGWFLIVVTLLMCLGNGFLAVKNSQDNDNKYKEDSTRFTVLLNEATKKRISDSIQISDLKSKSESIKLAVVDNAVKAMNEQRKIIEKDKENTFAHLQNEVAEDLQKILIHYVEKQMLYYADTKLFTTVRLNNSFLNKYSLISSQKAIMSHFTQASEQIETINRMLDYIANDTTKNGTKKYNTTQFLIMVEGVKNYLYPIYYRVRKLKSYKEFEVINLNAPLPKNYRDELNNALELDYMTGPKLK